MIVVASGERFNPLSPHDALKHHFTSLKTDFINVIFIHYKPRVAVAILDL